MCVVNAVDAEGDSVYRGVGVGAGHSDCDVAAAHPCGQPAEGHLDRGPVGGVGHQPVGQRMRAPIRGAGAGDPKMGQAGPAEVFDQGQRPGAHDFQRRRTGAKRLGGELGRHRASQNCTHLRSVSSAGSGRWTSHTTASVCPISGQPPGDSRG